MCESVRERNHALVAQDAFKAFVLKNIRTAVVTCWVFDWKKKGAILLHNLYKIKA